jgi:hypothetical protein
MATPFCGGFNGVLSGAFAKLVSSLGFVIVVGGFAHIFILTRVSRF